MTEKQQRSYSYLIIDDETPAHKSIIFNMARYPQLKLCGRAFNAREGLILIESLKPDIIFLNVTMPVITGLEMLDYFNTQDYYIILTTALPPATVLDPRVDDYMRVPYGPTSFDSVVEKFKMSL